MSCSAAPAGQAGNLLVEVMLAGKHPVANRAAENNEGGNSRPVRRASLLAEESAVPPEWPGRNLRGGCGATPFATNQPTVRAEFPF